MRAAYDKKPGGNFAQIVVFTARTLPRKMRAEGLTKFVRRAHPPTILNRFASNAEGLATSDKTKSNKDCTLPRLATRCLACRAARGRPGNVWQQFCTARAAHPPASNEGRGSDNNTTSAKYNAQITPGPGSRFSQLQAKLCLTLRPSPSL